ncbi:MAG TPA: response regulator [Desulfuromonadales bacterium]|nr:response regulator [Desulfuromonadales bacterium]
MSIKLLVADDSITIQKVIGIIFGGDEYSLTIVDNGKTALEKAREIVPDVLLIDALMPGMSGYEVAEAIRATPELALKPIMILTGSFEPFDETKAKSCGADDFLAKPFESQQIVTKVRDLVELGASRSHDAAICVNTAAVEGPDDSEAEAFSFADSSDVFAPLEEQVVTPPAAEPAAETAAIPPTSADIWDAFTPLVETETAPAKETVSFELPQETDVFALANAQPESPAEPSAAPTEEPVHHTGSQWIPVEENTFEFTEEVVSRVHQPSSLEPLAAPQPTEFGDITLENEQISSFITTAIDDVAPEPVVPEPVVPQEVTPVEVEPAPLPECVPEETAPIPAEEVPIVADVPAAEVPVAEAPAMTATLTEEQLKAAIASVSREVIERIVWEVVPDLAETLIKEAIRQIKEGR